MKTANAKPLGHLERMWAENEYGAQFQRFQDLMRHRIRDILLVSSLYDLYLFEEDGRLYELIREEYQGLHLSHAPELTRVSSGQRAIELAREEKRFDLIITTLHIEDMEAPAFARRVRESGLGIPVVLLANDDRELAELMVYQDSSVFDRVFIWQGDFRLIIAMIKHLEDHKNVENDTRLIGVQCVLLIEDNVHYYSSFLPMIYTVLFEQSRRVHSEGVSLSHRFLRMRARPKILLCTTYEEAWTYFSRYKEHVLGVISDIDFSYQGKPNSEAGIDFARRVRQEMPDVPILLHSNLPGNAPKAERVGSAFLLKDSPTLLHELHDFMVQNFGFGDFVFRTSDGRVVGRAHDLRSLEEQLQAVPAESIRYHGERNHFSNWLKARTEFWLASRLRPRKVSDYASLEALREDLISSLREYRKLQQRGVITDFDRQSFDPMSSFARIGGGSLGGKARGLSFVNRLINNFQLADKFAGVRIYVPSAVVLGTDVFDQFLDDNNLRNFALSATDDVEITRRFLRTEKFPQEIVRQLRDLLDVMRVPLAVRSSSLMEDSQYHSFAGVYNTFMLPNNDPDPDVRLDDLLNSIKRVYASTFYQRAKDYFKITAYRLEEERMAVIIQKMVGTAHGDRFYPDFAGVAKSHNFYPIPPQEANDGVVSVALGLGKTVVDGGLAVKFCPKYPNILPQFFSVQESLRNNQREFYALNLCKRMEDLTETRDSLVEPYPVELAEQDGTLTFVGSTYSPENDAIHDGLSRPGVRLVSFAPVLKNKLLRLPDVLSNILELGRWGMAAPVEIEFAVNMSVPRGEPRELGVLQMRPMVLGREVEALRIEEVPRRRLLCESRQVLGNGVIQDICDIVVVDRTRFERAKSREVAAEVNRFNAKLITEGRPYLLIGVGRWGTLDPWLGIPVTWEQICGARAIVEAGMKDLAVEPSQGSHFFHNISSFMVGYFTVKQDGDGYYLDWKWLSKQSAVEEMTYTRHLRFEKPLTVKMNSQQKRGVILKP